MKYIILVVLVLLASVAHASGSQPIEVDCYAGTNIVYTGKTDEVGYKGGMYAFIDYNGDKMRVPIAICIVNFGRNR